MKHDLTLMTELEYLNLIPDFSRFQGVDEASFLKSIPNQSIFQTS